MARLLLLCALLVMSGSLANAGCKHPLLTFYSLSDVIIYSQFSLNLGPYMSGEMARCGSSSSMVIKNWETFKILDLII